MHLCPGMNSRKVNNIAKLPATIKYEKWTIQHDTWTTLRAIILRSVPKTRDTCWQSAPSLLVKSPTVSSSKKEISWNDCTSKLRIHDEKILYKEKLIKYFLNQLIWNFFQYNFDLKKESIIELFSHSPNLQNFQNPI